jgi:cytochrome o ubiquinol oxidase operon protein cyoD
VFLSTNWSQLNQGFLACRILIVILVMSGSLWIMANLNHNMTPIDQLMQMLR